MHPIKIKILETNLIIDWDDRSTSSISLAALRKSCPCALCLSERDKQSIYYIPLFFGAQIKIVKINLIGNYGIEVIWADGHKTGIYEYSFLKIISDSASS